MEPFLMFAIPRLAVVSAFVVTPDYMNTKSIIRWFFTREKKTARMDAAMEELRTSLSALDAAELYELEYILVHNALSHHQSHNESTILLVDAITPQTSVTTSLDPTETETDDGNVQMATAVIRTEGTYPSHGVMESNDSTATSTCADLCSEDANSSTHTCQLTLNGQSRRSATSDLDLVNIKKMYREIASRADEIQSGKMAKYFVHILGRVFKMYANELKETDPPNTSPPRSSSMHPHNLVALANINTVRSSANASQSFVNA